MAMKKLILSLGLVAVSALAVGGCAATAYPAYPAYAYGPRGGYYYDNGYYGGGYYPGGYYGGYYANPSVVVRPHVYGGWGGGWRGGGGWGRGGGGWGRRR